MSYPSDRKDRDAEPDWPDGEEANAEERPAVFPWTEVQAAASIVLVHLALVVWMDLRFPPGWELLRQGGLLAGGTLEQPWRLVTSLFLHSGPSHALWNGLSLLVFSVPLLGDLGIGRTASLYLVSGVGGGVTALYFAQPGTVIVGSSGAVAGLFGAWVVLTLRRTRYMELRHRARVRAVGIAFLVLPSLLNPSTASGQPVSVSSHLGGMLTGMLIGAVLSLGLAPPGSPPEGIEDDRFTEWNRD